MSAAQNLKTDKQLRSLADVNRRKIIHMVWSEQKSAGEIAEQFNISRPAVSRHLRVLCEAELLQVEAQGTARLFRTNIQELNKLRYQFEQFWEVGLVRLKHIAEKNTKQKSKR